MHAEERPAKRRCFAGMMAAKHIGWIPVAAAKMASLRGEMRYKSASFNLTLLVQEAGSLEVGKKYAE
jgi:hypothetical protein